MKNAAEYRTQRAIWIVGEKDFDMRAYTFESWTDASLEDNKEIRLVHSLKLNEVDAPKPTLGRAIIKVKAFSIHRSDLVQQKNAKFQIPGHECVGIIYDLSGSYAEGVTPPIGVRNGTPVICLLGGLGDVIDGTYAEYVSVPLENVFPISLKKLDQTTWMKIASIPLTYLIAFGIIESLNLRQMERLLVRGGHGVAMAIISIAKAMGTLVVAVTSNPSIAENLSKQGADYVILDKLEMERNEKIAEIAKEFIDSNKNPTTKEVVDKILEISYDSSKFNTISSFLEKNKTKAIGVNAPRGIYTDVQMVFAADEETGAAAGAHKCVDFLKTTLKDSLQSCCAKAVCISANRYPIGLDPLSTSNLTFKDFGCKIDGEESYNSVTIKDASLVNIFDPSVDIPSGVRLTGFNLGDIPLHRVPFQDIIDRVLQGVYKSVLDQFYSFTDLPKALDCMFSNDHFGRLVVVMD